MPQPATPPEEIYPVELRVFTGGEARKILRIELYTSACWPADTHGFSTYREPGVTGTEIWIRYDQDGEEMTDYNGLTPKEAEWAAEDSGTWRREIATEAGMLGGCSAYNEVMGY